MIQAIKDEEGRPHKTPFMFKDSAVGGGKVTIAGGLLLNKVEDAQKLPFIKTDENGNERPATQQEIADAYRKVNSIIQPENSNEAYAADAFKPKKGDKLDGVELDNLKLPDDAIDQAFERAVRNSVGELKTKFPEFDEFPLGVKQALLDMEFNMGIRFHAGGEKNKRKTGTGWPELFKAIKAQDWNKAANESSRRDVSKDRNASTKENFLKGLK